MVQLTRMLKRIYAELKLTCDGSYDPHIQNIQRSTNTPNGGTAILQLLKKDTPYSEDPPRGSVSPVDVRSLLRKEFTSPINPDPERINPRHSEGMAISQKTSFSDTPRNPGRTQGDSDALTSNVNIRVNRDDVRGVLRDLILSEKFVSEFVERLVDISSNRR